MTFKSKWQRRKKESIINITICKHGMIERREKLIKGCTLLEKKKKEEGAFIFGPNCWETKSFNLVLKEESRKETTWMILCIFTSTFEKEKEKQK